MAEQARHWCWWSMWSDSESLAATCSWSDIRTGHHQHCHHHHYQHQHHHTVIVFIINVIIGKQFWESDGSVFIYATQGQKLNDQNFLCFSTFAASSIPFSQRQTSLLFWDIYSPPFLPILLLWENPLSSQKWGLCHSFSLSCKVWCFVNISRLKSTFSMQSSTVRSLNSLQKIYSIRTC